MKSFIVFALVFSFAVTKAISADNAAQNSSSAPSASAPPAKAKAAPARPGIAARNPATGTAAARPRPVPNVRRNHPTAVIPHRQGSLAMNSVRPTRNYQPRQTSNLPVATPQNNRLGREPTNADAQRPNDNRNSYADALKRCRYERHDRNWWRRHCRTIVFVNTGYYYLDAGYWYPAYGYDAAYDYYEYNGPIYTYGNLLPDQVIANVQLALREAGYYGGPITGSLGPATRAALANFQRDYGLIITGAVDEPTVQSLGLV
jgi:hypothetical protein